MQSHQNKKTAPVINTVAVQVFYICLSGRKKEWPGGAAGLALVIGMLMDFWRFDSHLVLEKKVFTWISDGSLLSFGHRVKIAYIGLFSNCFHLDFWRFNSHLAFCSRSHSMP